ncbi:MAG TPA: molybdenum cofactor guanylyltransferase [Anaerolinea sp.]|nr:molybdenum cofactor guanylyltransferase [Anaerolinea sp.]
MLTISVQAGGQSRRMGRDKALMPFLGRPLILRVIERVRPAAAELFLVANDVDKFHFTGLAVFPDRIPGLGVLGGLLTALHTASHPFVALVACDMPFASAALLAHQAALIEHSGADVVIPQSAHGLEPLHAVYRRETCLPLVEEAVHLGLRRMDSWFERAALRVLTAEETRPFDPAEGAFANLNTPEDLAWAEALALKSQSSEG